MTFPDKTKYPVSSRNNRDFLNLIDVYRTPYFIRLIYRNPNCLPPEGWHYELFEKDRSAVQGRRFQRDEGRISSSRRDGRGDQPSSLPRHLLRTRIRRRPRAIPELSYEQFLDSHRKYYHPTNAKKFPDGDVDTNAVLSVSTNS
jgi:Zn-dependent M16 (insulinase) family peptidase